MSTIAFPVPLKVDLSAIEPQLTYDKAVDLLIELLHQNKMLFKFLVVMSCVELADARYLEDFAGWVEYCGFNRTTFEVWVDCDDLTDDPTQHFSHILQGVAGKLSACHALAA